MLYMLMCERAAPLIGQQHQNQTIERLYTKYILHAVVVNLFCLRYFFSSQRYLHPYWMEMQYFFQSDSNFTAIFTMLIVFSSHRSFVGSAGTCTCSSVVHGFQEECIFNLFLNIDSWPIWCSCLALSV